MWNPSSLCATCRFSDRLPKGNATWTDSKTRLVDPTEAASVPGRALTPSLTFFFFHFFSLNLGYTSSRVGNTYTQSRPAAWFIPTDCPQLLQSPEPRQGMHSWDKSTNIHKIRGWWDLRQVWQKAIETCRAKSCCIKAHSKPAGYSVCTDLHGETARWKRELLI